MPTPEFILQGFTSTTHIDALHRVFDLPDVQKVLVSTAFASEGGVERIEEHLVPHVACTTVFVGIRNGATSYQGLARLHRVVNEIYTVDTGSRTVIFHPKLYLVRGRERARLIIGSANLTLAGLHYNIEAGMLLDFDLADVADKAEVDKIEMLFSASVTDYPRHIVKVGNIADLDELLAMKRLIDESVASSAREAIDSDAVASASEEIDVDEDADDSAIPRIRLKTGSLRSRAVKEHFVSNDTEHDKIPAEESEPVGLPPPVIDTEVEVVPRDATRFAFRTSRQSSRRGEGPRVRARRLRAEAKAEGKKWYFTGEPCIYGHVEDRLVSNGKCRECNRLDSERSNRLGLYR
ncbi:phospholipase D family protein [Bradyrhizobium paxllaeri]|uniref:phospholipase D family protein n=1 Tax=Bradyrhizobium paxllaeri TaxID=190148 RepID=UPI000810A3C0|nr:phospholipase D family protein [Bradyrhizobium paxllaeri]